MGRRGKVRGVVKKVKRRKNCPRAAGHLKVMWGEQATEAERRKMGIFKIQCVVQLMGRINFNQDCGEKMLNGRGGVGNSGNRRFGQIKGGLLVPGIHGKSRGGTNLERKSR